MQQSVILYSFNRVFGKAFNLANVVNALTGMAQTEEE